MKHIMQKALYDVGSNVTRTVLNKIARVSGSPVLPGMEEYRDAVFQGTTGRRGKRDIYNLRLLAGLKSSGHTGLPLLKGCIPSGRSTPLPFHEARSLWNKVKTLRGCFIHFYIDDDRFHCIRTAPERYLAMFRNADYIVAPDFSTYRNYPFPVLLKNGFDNMLLAAYYERHGVRVVPNYYCPLNLMAWTKIRADHPFG